MNSQDWKVKARYGYAGGHNGDAKVCLEVTTKAKTVEEVRQLAQASPELLESLQELSKLCGEANALQHASLKIPSKLWSDMHQANMQARAIIAKVTWEKA